MAEIRIKNTQVLRAIMEYTYAPLLITILCEVADKFGIFITEAWRKERHSGDVHSTKPGRGIDLRVRIYGNMERAEQIRDWINQRWEYDYRRTDLKVAIIHDTGEGEHFHIQTHPRTRLRQ